MAVKVFFLLQQKQNIPACLFLVTHSHITHRLIRLQQLDLKIASTN